MEGSYDTEKPNSSKNQEKHSLPLEMTEFRVSSSAREEDSRHNPGTDAMREKRISYEIRASSVKNADLTVTGTCLNIVI